MPEKDADMRSVAVVLALAVSITGAEQRPDRDQVDVRSYWLEDLAWMEVAQVLGADTVVLIPLGAAALEHGPHLKLRTEAVLAGHLTRRVASATPVVVAPMVTYHYYPGFGDFPGTASLSLDTARNLTIDAVLTGLCTLAVRRIEGAWRIEAYRYTSDVSRDPLPTLLKRPGYRDEEGGTDLRLSPSACLLRLSPGGRMVFGGGRTGGRRFRP